jgi:hypothetical protein
MNSRYYPEVWSHVFTVMYFESMISRYYLKVLHSGAN